MSREDLDVIQAKLKAAIQNHQKLVVKMKGDNQNLTLKKGLTELQGEIKRLSEEQKKIVMIVRESLVKASTQTQQQLPATPVATVGQTITALGQPHLVSFPTQGGATVLPVGMVAVPLAHMQRPAVGMAIHPVNVTQVSLATSISLIPTGMISSGCTIGPINSDGTISLGNNIGNILQGNITINAINTIGNNCVTSINSSPTTASSVTAISNNSKHVQASNGIMNGSSSNGGVVTSAVAGCVPSSSISLSNLTAMTNLIIGNNINNSSNNVSSSIIPNSGISSSSNFVTVNNSSVIPATPANQVASTIVGASGPGIVISAFPQQPLVQPQLLQQQQQQILQMIQQQQQQQPQQRLASHTPIKVPQYTASVIRPTVCAASGHYCSIAPAPSSAASIATVKSLPSSSSHTVTIAKSNVGKDSVVTVGVKEMKQAQRPEILPLQQNKQFLQQQKTQQHNLGQQQQQKEQLTPQGHCLGENALKKMQSGEEEKLKYMKALDLYTSEALKEILSRRTERKRRSTANPNYSFGFEITRRDRNGSIWATIPPKKSRASRNKGAAAADGFNWVDSSNAQSIQHESKRSHKSNDNHDDYCAVCGKGGQLLMCETCRLVYHLDCLSPPLTEAPKYAWSCPKCLVSGKGLAHLSSEALAKVHSYIAKKAAKEDERKKVQRKGREINTEKSFLDNRSKELDSKMKEQLALSVKLSDEEQKVKDDLNKLSDFVRVMRESRSSEHNSIPEQKAQ